MGNFDGLGLAGKSADLAAKFTAYLEWLPEQGVGELKVIDPKGIEVMRYRYAKGSLTPITEHGGRPLKGLSKRALEKITPTLNAHLKTIVERAGGRWVAEMAVHPPPRGGGAGVAIKGIGFWLLVAEIILSGPPAYAPELPQPIILPISLEDAGITSEMFVVDDQEGRVEQNVQGGRVQQSGEISACKSGFVLHTVEKGDSCWCLWQRRTNKILSWARAQTECNETCKSGKGDTLEVGESICVPE